MFWKFKKLIMTGMLRPNLTWSKMESFYSSLSKYYSCCAYDLNALKNIDVINSKSHFFFASTTVAVKNQYTSNKTALWNNGTILHKKTPSFSPVYQNNSFRCLSTSSHSHNSSSPTSENGDAKVITTATQLPSCNGGVEDSVPVQTFGDSFSTAVPTQALEAPVMAAAGSKRMLMLPDFPLIQGAEASVFYTHLFTGLPWWSTIVLTALVARQLLILPLNIYQEHNMAKVKAQQPEVKALGRKIQAQISESRARFFWTEQKTKLEFNRMMKKKVSELRVRDNCHPMKNIAATYMQIPVFVGLSFALRNISVRAMNPNMDHHSDFVSLTEQGTAWFPDLTLTDSTLILPLMLGAVTLFNIEMNYLNATEMTKYRKYLTYFLRSVSVIMVPICATVPTVLAVYWVSSGVFTASTNILLNYSRFRRLVKLPQSAYETDRPIRSLVGKAKKKYFKS